MSCARRAECCPAPAAEACCASDRTRGGLFGETEAQQDVSSYDPEKLERQNEAELEHMNERAKHLKEARERARLPRRSIATPARAPQRCRLTSGPHR